MSAVNAMLILGVLMIAAGCWCLIRTYHMVVGTGADGGVDGFSYTTTDAGGTPTTCS